MEKIEAKPAGIDSGEKARGKDIRGGEVESLGSTWKLAPLGLAKVLTRARDAIYDDLTISQEVEVRDVKECAYIMLQANYTITPTETMAVIEGAEFADLANAVIDGLFVHDLPEKEQTYTRWARSALIANGIDPTKVDRADMPGVLRQLVETRRAMTLTEFTAAGEFQRARAELMEMI